MNSDSFLLSFDMKPEDFDRTEWPITSDEDFVYESLEARRTHECPRCHRTSCVIKVHYSSDMKEVI